MASNFHVYDNTDLLAVAASDFILENINACLSSNSRCRIALPGGRTPASCLKLIAQSNIPWEKIEWYLGDERCLPIGDEERNDSMVRQNLFSNGASQENNFFPIAAELGAEKSAEDYSKIINAFKVFDIVILGMGEDGHTASLFPDNIALNDTSSSVVPVHNAPKPPGDRVSLSLKTLSDAKLRIVLAAGSDKKTALGQIKAGERLPINCIGDCEWFVDNKAVN